MKKSNGTAGTLYWRNLSGETIAETDLSGNITSEYVFFAGRRIARRDASGNIFFYDADHLGTTRTITDSSGNICYDADLTPYGQEITVHSNSCPQNYKFTGYERDQETGLDYAMFRYYNPRLGRFMSPDPLGGDVGNPQTLNRYAYVLNNPLALIDPLGLDPTADPCAKSTAPGGCGSVTATPTDGPHVTDVPGICMTVMRNNIVVSSSNGCSPYPLSDRSGTIAGASGGAGGGSGSGPANNGPKQTFSQCMAANSSTFSLAGLAQGALNGVLSEFGTSVNFKDTFLAQLIGGNSISGILFGSATDAAVSAGTNTPGLLHLAMGTVTTYGRRSSTIMSLNIAGQGGLPQALSSASGGLKSVLGAADSVLSLGMSFATRLEIDAAFAGAEAAYCAHKTK
ncbi:MAG: hypothetical protein LAN61_02515 [Acidobacteriia bacterium]|nr:hypothetical protein [Terriglobia bacterium]